MRRYYRMFFIILLCFIGLTGCKDKKEDSNYEIEKESEEDSNVLPDKEEEQKSSQKSLHKGQKRSLLTGKWIEKELVNNRPFAIMFNNHSYASPQSGIGEAAILYEALTEGGITRLMGIFEQLHKERIGSIRSARHYFVSFANDYDAIFVHYGQTKYAQSKLNESNTDNLNGLEAIGDTVFYRDTSIKAPHNAFTSYDKIMQGLSVKGYRTAYREGYQSPFSFYTSDKSLKDGSRANKVILEFSAYISPYFMYNKKKKVYERFQFGEPHLDYNTQKQLSFKNIIIQFVKEWDIDRNNYQTMEIEDVSGTGYYITNGKSVPIKWIRKESELKMEYQTEDGKTLKINPGKTYIAVFPSNREDKIQLSE